MAFDPYSTPAAPSSRGIDLFSGPLRLALIQAARDALHLQSRLVPECKADGTLVTPADRQIEADLERVLAASPYQNPVIGEEAMALRQSGTGFDLSRRLWVIDPIDGTALYTFRMNGWGISLGLMDQGRFLDGIVLFPSARPGPTTLVIGGSGDSCAKTWIDLENGLEQPDILRKIPQVGGFPGLLGISQTLAKHALYDGPHTVLNTASCVSSLYHLIEGSLCGYCAKVKLWDMAALWPLARRLGIRACDAQGNEMGETLDEAVWYLDPASEKYLAQKSHILYYHPALVDPQGFWRDLHWRDGGAY